MSCLIWNCCGLGNPCIVNELAEMVRAKDLFVVFLAETWANEVRLKDVKKKIQLKNMFVSPRTTRGGGLVLFWRESVDILVEVPWLCAGDFNELVQSEEKLGGNRISHNQMQLFQDANDACGFIDLGYSGSKFT
ncbi:hypothetical protein ACB092_02G142600 [Castanea dentata]